MSVSLPAAHRLAHIVSPGRQRDAVGMMLAALLLACPAPAAAGPREEFTDALQRFATAVAGAFGDEGASVAAALESMERALAQWDAEVRSLESRVADELSKATDRTAAQLHISLGRVYAARGRLSDARREFEAAARRDPSRADVHRLIGLAHEAAGDAMLAVAAYRTAFKLDPDDATSAYRVLQENKPGADPDVRPAIDTLAAAVRVAMSRTDGSPQQPFATISLLDPLRAEPTLALPAVYAPGVDRLMRGDPAGAVAAFRNALASDPLLRDPALPSGLMTQGSEALRHGRLGEARQHFRAAIAAHPDSSEAHRLLGVTCWADFDLAGSVDALHDAIRLRSDDERSRIMLVRVLVQMEALGKAEAAAREAIAALPASPLAHLWHGSVLASLNRQEEAAQALWTAAPQLLAGADPVLKTVASLRESAADFDGMISALRRAAAVNPNDSDTHAALGRALMDQDRTDAAFAEYVAALLIDSRHPGAHMGIGQLHLDAGRYEEATSMLQRLVTLHPTYTQARYALASALLRAGREEEGRREMAQFGRLQAAEAERKRQAMALDVVKEEAALRASEGRLDRAVELWQQALAQEPDAAATHAALASALAGSGRQEAAVQHYERAAALGGRPDVYRHLAALYASMGRDADSAAARKRYEPALLVPASGARR